MSELDRILIAGGGIGGLAAAIALDRAGFEVDVYERVSELREIGAGLMINSNGVLALRHLGLDQMALAEGEAARRGALRWWTGKVLFEFPVAELEREMGAPVLAIHRGRMLQTLLKAFGDERIHTDSKVLGCRQNGHWASLELADGRSVRGALVIAADGIHSTIRQQLHGDGAPRYAGYTSWRGITQAVDQVGEGVGAETWGPGRRFGFMHIGYGEMCWFGMVVAPPNGKDEPGRLHETLLRRFRDWPEHILELVRSTPEDRIVRTDIMDREPVAPWGRGRVTLLGDAAHPMTPNMGQGASQAIEDAVILADSLQRCDNPVEGLRLYEKRRVPRVHWIVSNSRKFGEFAQMTNPLLCHIRNLLMRWAPQKRSVEGIKNALRFSLES